MPVNSFEDYPMSWKPVLDRRQRSLYKALARQLQDDVEQGLLRPGTKLPPQRELADFLDINLSTVTKAYKLCEMKGLLSGAVGNGTYVSYDALTSPRLIEDVIRPAVINMGATVPEPSGNAILMELCRELIHEEGAEQIFSYHPSEESLWQLDTAVRLMDYCGHRAEREQIFLSNGGQNGLSAILAALFRRGQRIAVDDHTYPGIKTAAAMFGIQLLPIPQTEKGMDMAALEQACKSEGVNGIYVIPACHNPTTRTMPDGERQELARLARRYDCLLLEDATYQLMDRGGTAVSDYAPERSIYIVSLSKAIAPGLRLSYLSVPLPYQKKVSDALYSLNVAVVPLMAELAARIIASGKFEGIIASHAAHTAQRNGLVNQYFSRQSCWGKDTDIFRWLLLPERYSGKDFERLALKEGVQVFGAEKFAVGKTRPAPAVRLSICAPPSLEELRQGLQVLAQLVKE